MAWNKRLGFDPCDTSTFNYRSFVHIGNGKLVDLQKMPQEPEGDKAKLMTRVYVPMYRKMYPDMTFTINPECYDVDLEQYLADEETTRKLWVGTKWGEKHAESGK